MNLKDGLFLILGAGWTNLPGASILMYHSIAERTDHFNSVAPREFSRQLAYLKDRKYNILSLSELVRRLSVGESVQQSVTLTFDDGYRNNYTEAFPLLKRYQFPATIFVVTSCIGWFNEKLQLEYLRESEIKEMENSGLIDIEPHTVTHPKLATLDSSATQEEMRTSRQAIEQLLGKKARFFAYPYGNFSPETVNIAQECGFEAAVTVREGIVQPDSKLLELPRASVDRSTTFMQFKGKTSGALDRYQALKRIWE